MWFYLLFVGVGLFCLAGMGYIVARKFPQVTIINTDAIPAEQAARKKREILQGRVARQASAIGRRIATGVSGHAGKAGEALAGVRERLKAMEKQYQVVGDKTPAPAVPPKEKANSLVAEAGRLLQLGDSSSAEEKFIEAISYDAKEERAYRGLAIIYADTKRHDQALETLDFLARIMRRESGCVHGEGAEGGCPASPAAHAEIAAVAAAAGMSATALGDGEGAKQRLLQAVVLAPMNPRYLDLALESCLVTGDREVGEKILARLKSANPENQKIGLFEEKLTALPEKQA